MTLQERKPRRGDLLEVAIEALDERGRGVGRLGAGTAVVRGALPGARVTARVLRRRGERVEARLEALRDAGPFARAPRCPHAGVCGGCAFQTLDDGRQLVELRALVASAFARAGLALEVAPVLGCEDPWHYRNKMDFSFSNRRWIEEGEPEGAPRDFALGLHVPGRWDKVLDVERCAIHFREADALLSSVRRLAREHALPPWDVHTHSGLLRHLVLRKGVRTGELLVALVTSEEAPERVDPLARDLLARHPELTTIVQLVNTRAAAVAIGEHERVLHGPGRIRERLCGLELSLSAGSFFQTNTIQAERLVELVREEARLAPSDVLFDLYCGVGTIGLALARDCRELHGLELFAPAVEDARANARAAGIESARFTAIDVSAAGAVLAGSAGLPAADVVVVDPPRAGLHPAVVSALCSARPRRIVYVSCNPAAAARDAAALVAAGYRAGAVRPIDLFPHTPHVECVLAMEREA